MTAATRAVSAIALSGFRSVPTAAVRQVAASGASAADRAEAEAAAPAAVGDCSRKAVSFQQSASDTPFAMADLSGYAALTRPTAER